MPKVSVLLPTYNTNPQHLRECIDSILAQTLTDFELLILDDCSPSAEVKNVIDTYTDPRICFQVNEKNLGISGTRNKLIELAKGEYLAVCDHDDISMPERFELQSSFLDAHPDVGMVGGWLVHLPRMMVQKFPEDNEDILDGFMYSDVIPHQSSMIRKKVLLDNGLQYEEEYSPAEDYRLCLRMIGKCAFANLPQVLLQYRKYEGNTSRVKSRECDTKAEVARDIARSDNPFIWYRARSRYALKTRYKLFGKLTLFTTYQIGSEKTYRLFDFFTVFVKNQSNRLPKKKVKSRPAV